MLSLKQFLSEATHVGGIQHIEHPSDRSFDSKDAARHALSTLRGVLRGKTPITRKIDDKMSYQVIRNKEGKVGVKYKGPGSHYNFSNADIEKQHGHKPYLAGPLKSLLQHVGKVLPQKEGEYQGGFMSDPSTREVKNGHITHTPNTIEYKTPTNSPEGKKLAASKVSTVIHSELKGPNRVAHPITDTSHFGSHPDVHLVQHLVSPEHRKVSSDVEKVVNHHLDSAEQVMKNHSYAHLAGHEQHLRSYINKTVSSGEAPSVDGYKKHLSAVHQKKIDSVKTQAAKDRKTAEMNNDLQHVQKNAKHFDKSLEIHHHLQQATNYLARGLDAHGAGGFTTHINDKPAGGEGYVASGIKVVDREGFSKANRERSEILRAGRGKK